MVAGYLTKRLYWLGQSHFKVFALQMKFPAKPPQWQALPSAFKRQ